MNFLEYPFYFVSSSDAYKDALGFHNNFFVTLNGFLWALLVAAGIALVFAGLFYFAFARNNKLATKLNWFICGILIAAASYGACDLFLIGGQGSESVNTFYGANEQLVRDNRSKPNAKQYAQLKIKIQGELQKQKDVRVPFDFTCAFWSFLFFFVFSAVMKGYNPNTKKIPF